MSARFFSLCLTAAMLPGCATTPPPSLSLEQTAAVCAMVKELSISGDWEPVEGDNMEAVRALDAAVQPAEFEPLPERVECEWGRTRLRLERGQFGEFFSDYWLSSDAAAAGLHGGWIGGQLAGATGVCYFTKVDGKWTRLGCITTSLI